VRTTVDLPDELMRAAKARAAERGESLRELFTRAVAGELGTPPRGRPTGRVTLPLVGRGATPSREVTNLDIEAALAADDADKTGDR
jgi:hypothetical protein